MQDAWWLKLKRAQYHMVELDREARRYAEMNVHVVERVPNTKQKPNRWIYKLKIVEQPNPMIAVIFGEFVHNLRSALDNIVVASVPAQRRKSASFPVLFEDIWARGPDGEYIVRDEKRRESFATQTEGLDPVFIEAIKTLQPYQHGPQEVETQVIGMLSRLENADKHRQLIAIGAGLRDATTTVRIKDGVQVFPAAAGRRELVDDGAIVSQFDWAGRARLLESEVNVEVSGTPVISIRVGGLGGNSPVSDFRLQSALWKPLTDIRYVIRRAERFVLPDAKLPPVHREAPRGMRHV